METKTLLLQTPTEQRIYSLQLALINNLHETTRKWQRELERARAEILRLQIVEKSLN